MNVSAGEPVASAAADIDCRTWYMCMCALAALLLVYAALEVHYFIRFLLCVFTARFFKSRLHVLDQATVQGTHHHHLIHMFTYLGFIVS